MDTFWIKWVLFVTWTCKQDSLSSFSVTEVSMESKISTCLYPDFIWSITLQSTFLLKSRFWLSKFFLTSMIITVSHMKKLSMFPNISEPKRCCHQEWQLLPAAASSRWSCCSYRMESFSFFVSRGKFCPLPSSANGLITESWWAQQGSESQQRFAAQLSTISLFLCDPNFYFRNIIRIISK